MNTPRIIFPERAASKKQTPISLEDTGDIMSAYPFRSPRHFGRALSTTIVVAVIALVGVLSSGAFAANPAEEMARRGTTTTTTTTGGTDPHGDSWLSIQHSIQQFAHPEF